MSVAKKLKTENTETLKEDVDIKPSIEHLPHFNDDIPSLQLNNKYSDLTIIIGDEKLHAHKIILTCRSKYFKNLLSNGLQETNLIEITLDDIPIEAFKLLLQYIYTGVINLNNLNEDLICNILILSVRYFIDELKNLISDFLKKTLRTDNVLNILNVAHKYSIKNLIEDCYDFSDKNATEIIIGINSFLNLSKNALIDLIKRDTFFAPELMISFVTINWCKTNKDEDIEVLKWLRLTLLTVPELVILRKLLNNNEIYLQLVSTMDDVVLEDNRLELMKLPYRGQLVLDKNVGIKLISRRTKTKDEDEETITNSEIIKLDTPSFINYIEMRLVSRKNVSYFINGGVDKSKLKNIVDYTSYRCLKDSLQFLYFEERVVQFIQIRTKDEVPINLRNGLKDFKAMYKSKTPKIIDGIICPDYNVATGDKGAKVFTCKLNSMKIESGRDAENLIDGETYNSCTCHTIGSECFLIQLAQPYVLSNLRLLLNAKDRDNYYNYYIETSIDKINWENLIDKRIERCKSWQNIKFPPRKIVFFRIVGTNSRADDKFQCVHFECPSSVENESDNELNDNKSD